MSFYAVANGKSVGIFKNWNDCKNSILGYSNAVFKKLKTQQEAEDFICRRQEKDIITDDTCSKNEQTVLENEKQFTPPANLGMKWNEDEETELLEEIHQKMDNKAIAQKHQRTVGGITSRIRHIAYEMYLKKISMEEIEKVTQLDGKQVLKIIEKKQIENDAKQL